MNNLGTYQSLNISQKVTDGFVLTDDDNLTYFMSENEVNLDWAVGDTRKVFTYLGQNQLPTATTVEPLVTVGTFSILEVVRTDANGAYLDWGMDVLLFAPNEQQHKPFELDKWYLVTVLWDDENQLLMASSLITDLLDNSDVDYKVNEAVDIIFYEQTKLGYNVIVNNRHHGLVYHDEIFQEVTYGERAKGYVKKVREENKLDILLQPIGHARIDASEMVIVRAIKAAKGFLPLHDKSNPQEIIDTLGMSKKTFKKAVGGLYKQKWITIEENGIRLI
jgi:predicted RNA-binding protein (virulence factor B family)